MLKMRPYAPPDQLAVRDCLDDDISDDIEDDVFIRDGRLGKNSEECGLKRPLMPPRRKNGKLVSSTPIMKRRPKCWRWCEPFCYGLAAITILIALIFFGALLLTMFPVPLQKIKYWFHKEDIVVAPSKSPYDLRNVVEQVPCSQITVRKVWSKALTRMSSESPVRKTDIDGDGVLDIVIGYGIDEDNPIEASESANCVSPRTSEVMICEGGVLAINGATGNTLWQRWTAFNIFSLYCMDDLSGDKIVDCVAAGRGGLILAMNGRNGSILWMFNGQKKVPVAVDAPVDLYTVNPVRDIDNDGITDILGVHVEQGQNIQEGHIVLISGSTGKYIQSVLTPNHEEGFVPIQVFKHTDGTDWLLLLTGGISSYGGIYAMQLSSLIKHVDKDNFVTIFHDESFGFMSPAIRTDITGDSVDDIIVAAFNSTIFAFNGKNYEIIWQYAFPASESVSQIVPGHFDKDNVTDFMVKYNTGTGFPVYYYSQTMILSGRNGEPMLDNSLTDAGMATSSLGGLSVSQSFGGDFFLHWQTHCRNRQSTTDSYRFIPDTEIVQQARADTCLLRYNTSTVLKLYAIGRHMQPPGAVIFSTDDLILQLNRTNLIKSKQLPILKHPKLIVKSQSLESKKAKPIANEEHQLKTAQIHENNIPIPVVHEPINDPQLVEQINNNPYIYLPFGSQNNRQWKEPIQINRDQKMSGMPDDYDVFYNDEQNQRVPAEQFPASRDIRSELNMPTEKDEKPVALTEPADRSSVKSAGKIIPSSHDINTMMSGNAIKDRPESLWDLELEKEASETNDGNFDYPAKQVHLDVRDVRELNEAPETDGENENVLASVTTPGVLVKSLNDTPSTIDLIFVLNVRESESYPPLLLPEDLECLKEKENGYEEYISKDGEKKFLKQCLKKRIPNMASSFYPRYETQIVITRISITCSCGQLNIGEECSKLNAIDQQRWTEFMGSKFDGAY